MKFIILVLFCVFSTSETRTPGTPNRIILLIDQPTGTRCVPSDINMFWASHKNFDTIQFSGQAITGKLNKCVDELEPQNPDSATRISITACLIRYIDKLPIDTLYSWQWFNYWKKGDIMYEDKTGELRHILKNLNNGFWD